MKQLKLFLITFILVFIIVFVIGSFYYHFKDKAQKDLEYQDFLNMVKGSCNNNQTCINLMNEDYNQKQYNEKMLKPVRLDIGKPLIYIIISLILSSIIFYINKIFRN